VNLRDQLERLPVPASDEALERTVAIAREQSPAPRGRPTRAIAAVTVGVLALGALSPPGRAALDQAAELLGIGTVGGTPTLKQGRGLEELTEPLVIDNGRAPDGRRYEWVAYRGGERYRIMVGGRVRRQRFVGFCFSLEWPGTARRRAFADSCAGRGEPAADTPYDNFVVSWVQSRSERTLQRDVVILGTTDPGVHRVRVVYEDASGRRRDLTVDSRRVEGGLLGRVGGFEPLLTFVAFVPGRLAARDRFAERFGGRFDRLRLSLAVKADELPSKARSPSTRPPGPLTLTAYDAQGRVIDRHTTIVTPRLPPLAQRQE
jgi:hypothetical protein